jgi:hypothetical protein
MIYSAIRIFCDFLHKVGDAGLRQFRRVQAVALDFVQIPRVLRFNRLIRAVICAATLALIAPLYCVRIINCYHLRDEYVHPSPCRFVCFHRAP